MEYIIKYNSTTGSSYSNTLDKANVDLTKPYFADKFQNNCLHRNCSLCGGTGVRKDTQQICVHMISCPCPLCSPQC